ncbi:MAG: hypothetical protein QOJ58_3940, partial [Alphaproteobacteria bacterium]|nr:hypothetical protein [Alphaproteobacteria bacterium]
MTSGTPACAISSSVPTDTFFNVTVTCLAGQVGIVEFVRVAQEFARDEFDIFAAKHVAFARCEVPKGHFERAADFWFQMMHSAGKAVG